MVQYCYIKYNIYLVHSFSSVVLFVIRVSVSDIIALSVCLLLFYDFDNLDMWWSKLLFLNMKDKILEAMIEYTCEYYFEFKGSLVILAEWLWVGSLLGVIFTHLWITLSQSQITLSLNRIVCCVFCSPFIIKKFKNLLKITKAFIYSWKWEVAIS